MDVSDGVMGTQCTWNFEKFVEFEVGNERPLGMHSCGFAYSTMTHYQPLRCSLQYTGRNCL